jgi:membrane dipeptidase
MTSLLWDQHLCLPLPTDSDVDPLTRSQRDGGVVVSFNAGYSPHNLNDTLSLLHHYRCALDAHPDLDLAPTVGDVAAITDASWDERHHLLNPERSAVRRRSS